MGTATPPGLPQRRGGPDGAAQDPERNKGSPGIGKGE
jgi:hypothetical protein